MAPHFSPRPLHTESDAVAAFYEQWKEARAGSLESSRGELRGKRVSNEWVLHRDGSDLLDIHLDAATGRVKAVRRAFSVK